MSLNTAKSALIVGGTSGIGQGIALALARRGSYDVAIAGRSKERAEAVLEQLREASPERVHTFVPIDAFDLKSLSSFQNQSPDVLVMTQGMATIQGYTPTIDGIDQKLQLHYFSRIQLIRIMAPNLQPGTRILSVLSAGVHNRYESFQDHFDLKDNYSIPRAADAAGFYNDAGLEQLSILHPTLIMAHACPGFVNTNWGTEMPWYLKCIIRAMQPFGRSLETSGSLLAEGLLCLPTEPTKKLYMVDQDGKVMDDSKIRHTAEERDIIWAKTLDLLPDIVQ